AERKVGIDALLERRQPELLKTDDRRLSERLVDEVGQRGAAPERQGFAQRRRGALGATGRKLRATLTEEALEAAQVELLGLELERVAGRPRDEQRPDSLA